MEWGPGLSGSPFHNMSSEKKQRKTVHKALDDARKDTDVSDHDNDGMRCVAVQTESEFNDMVRECGQDPDKRKRWRRDHPRSLTASPKKHGMPSKKSTFLIKENPL